MIKNKQYKKDMFESSIEEHFESANWATDQSKIDTAWCNQIRAHFHGMDTL